MSSRTKPDVSLEEYLALERKAEYKSEYLNGEIFAMTGASRKHNLITTNIVSTLHQQLKGKALGALPGQDASKGAGHWFIQISRCNRCLWRSAIRR
jgi:Uma2 family endonuclease